MPAGLDVLTMGRIGVDLYPEQSGVPLSAVRTFRKMLGGSATNVAVAAARLGLRTGVVTAVGADPFGEYARLALEEFGVSPAHVAEHPTLRTPLAFCELFPPDDFPILFYRQPTAPDLTLEPGQVDLDAVGGAGVFWTTGTGLSVEPSRSTTLGALRARGRREHTVHDLDHRPGLWPDPREARRWQREALRHATVAVGNLTEVSVVADPVDPVEAGRAVLDLGPTLAVVKMGPRGVIAVSRDEMVHVDPIQVAVVNGLGAGDAFGGALCLGLHEGWPLARMISFANAAGALVASRLGCADDMPARDEVQALADRLERAEGPEGDGLTSPLPLPGGHVAHGDECIDD